VLVGIERARHAVPVQLLLGGILGLRRGRYRAFWSRRWRLPEGALRRAGLRADGGADSASAGRIQLLNRSRRIFSRIIDELEQQIIFGLLVDSYRVLMNFAAHADDVSANNLGRLL
jgi:hypothetical protein